MRLPRDISGEQLIKFLVILGYRTVRQTGSHIRITTEQNGTHSLTISEHDPLKIGTLSAILNDVANHFSMSKDELLQKLFY